MSSFKPVSIVIIFRSSSKSNEKELHFSLNTRRGNKSPREAIWRSRMIIRDGGFINGGMREQGPLTPPPFPYLDRISCSSRSFLTVARGTSTPL